MPIYRPHATSICPGKCRGLDIWASGALRHGWILPGLRLAPAPLPQPAPAL